VQEICHIACALVKIKQEGFHANSTVNLENPNLNPNLKPNPKLNLKPNPKLNLKSNLNPKNNKKLILLFNYVLIYTKLLDLALRRRLFI